MYDVIVVGGSYAGMSAALQMARARLKILILDGGKRRNFGATSSHGFLTQDGQSPEAIASKGRADVMAYPTVTWREIKATETRKIGETFVVQAGDETFESKRLVLAAGVRDELPTVPGVAERWAKSIFHCPYCHGYELQKGKVALLATGPFSGHHALMVFEWAGEMTLFLNGIFEPDADMTKQLEARKITVERTPLAAVEGEGPGVEVVLHDGRREVFDAMFLGPKTHLNGPFHEQLGCLLEDGPVGRFYKTDATKETSVAGVFACGDAAMPAATVALVIADGANAGFNLHRKMVFPEST